MPIRKVSQNTFDLVYLAIERNQFDIQSATVAVFQTLGMQIPDSETE